MSEFLDQQQERGYVEQSNIESFAGEYFAGKAKEVLAFLKKRYNMDQHVCLPRAVWEALYDEIKDQV